MSQGRCLSLALLEVIRYLLWENGILSFQKPKGPIRSTCQQTVGTGRMGRAFLLAFPLGASLCQDLGWGKGQRRPDGLWERKGQLSQLQFI